ncbi:EcoAI/FtnUII family type I restriction enzme subunit R [Nocardiopsis sp. NPDC006198]|uniref:EcoAI/FtnUII family type I restriction enzme subunit R n=1 Tax=Nocardiopsis sp. NPDC006198 TaxID=3154472 RepID=UPI0033AE498D
MGLNEADTRAKLIDPKLVAAGWSEAVIEREFTYKRGRVRLVGEQSIRDQPQFCDYVLRDGARGPILAIVEAKDEEHSPSDGLQQALGYAVDLGVYFAYSSNGHGIVEHDRLNDTVRVLKAFPSSDELRKRLAAGRQTRGPVIVNPRGEEVTNPIIQPAWPSPTGGMRWYQERAVTATLEEMIEGKRRALLSLATGTGKTYIAFNLAWKLLKSGYAKRVLFLADRVSLRDQAFNEFGPFEESRGVVVGEPPLARDVHFAIYQTLYVRGEDGKRLYERYPSDFFDLVIVDECHRSGYGDWQVILDHFSHAFHLGMTATPKRTDNIDTYEFFAGENRNSDGNPMPVFEYSLGRGIDDGFLATYRVRQVRTNIDQSGLRIGEEVEQGADLIVPEGTEVKDIYTSSEFERAIVVEDRTRVLCEHLAGLLRQWGPNEKTMVFCVTMEHAANVRDHMQNLLGPETGKEHYAVRVVSEEPAAQALLEEFQLSSSTQPMLATTVDLLTTGVNVPACRNIVFMKPISSPTVFRQILGRGSRLDAATGKEFFRIIDYTGATRLLDEWDLPPSGHRALPEKGAGVLVGKVVTHDSGEPIKDSAIVVRGGMRTLAEAQSDGHGLFHVAELPEATLTVDVAAKGYTRRRTRVPVSAEPIEVVIALRQPQEGTGKLTINGTTVNIAEETDLTLGSGEELTVQQYIDRAGEQIRTVAVNVNTLSQLWRDPTKRAALREQLAAGNADPAVLSVLLERPDADEYDLLAFAGYQTEIRSREERARQFEQVGSDFLSEFTDVQRQVVSLLIDKYRLAGIEEIASAEVFSLSPFVEQFSGARGIIKIFGSVSAVKNLLRDLQEHLYKSNGESAA